MIKLLIYLLQFPIFTRITYSANLIHTVGKRRNSLPGRYHIVIVGFLNTGCKLIALSISVNPFCVYSENFITSSRSPIAPVKSPVSSCLV